MVFDTMVLAYALLDEPVFGNEARRALDATEQRWAPDLFRAELANVVWQWIRARSLSIAAGLQVLHDADALVTQVVSTIEIWEQALRLAVVYGHSPYDTLFVALAASKGWKVITYDRSILKRFPDYTISVPDYLDTFPKPPSIAQ